MAKELSFRDLICSWDSSLSVLIYFSSSFSINMFIISYCLFNVESISGYIPLFTPIIVYLCTLFFLWSTLLEVCCFCYSFTLACIICTSTHLPAPHITRCSHSDRHGKHKGHHLILSQIPLDSVHYFLLFSAKPLIHLFQLPPNWFPHIYYVCALLSSMLHIVPRMSFYKCKWSCYFHA